MKHFNLRKIAMMLALVIIIQNGVIIIQDTTDDTGSYSEDGEAAPLSDLPYIDDDYT